MVEHEPPPDEEDGPEPEEGDQPPAHPGRPDEDIKDPFKRETIRYASEHRVLGVRLDGPKVGRDSMDVFLLGEFLSQLDRVVRGLAAAVRNIPLESTGRIPTPPDAAPWHTRGVVFGNSAILEFELGEGEAMRISDEGGGVSSPTTEAVGLLDLLIRSDASEAVETTRDLDDRIGRDFTRLLGLLADNDLESRWEPLQRESVLVPPSRADRVRAVLRSEAEPHSIDIDVTGFLFQLNAKKHDFKIEPDEGQEITGSYDDSLVDQLRSAWRHRVRAAVTRTERRFVYASRPHRVDHELKGILAVLEPVD
jgi:hypothetical protein